MRKMNVISIVFSFIRECMKFYVSFLNNHVYTKYDGPCSEMLFNDFQGHRPCTSREKKCYFALYGQGRHLSHVN